LTLPPVEPCGQEGNNGKHHGAARAAVLQHRPAQHRNSDRHLHRPQQRRSTRGQLVDDLAKLFSFAREQGGTPLIVPSFELIKYKYDETRDPIPASSWGRPVLIYVVLSFLGFVTAFGSPDLFRR
jgi:hypothetical protein